MIVGMLLSIIPWLGSPAPVERMRRHDGAWVLEVARSRFTHETHCTLKGRGAEVAGAALVLHLSQSTDTSEAWYRLGHGGEARSWRLLIPELRQAGVRLRYDDLENPSQGRVPIPLRRLWNEETVEIAATSAARPILFKIRGLKDAILDANARGCGFASPEGAGQLTESLRER
jgi:hypothetical protein